MFKTLKLIFSHHEVPSVLAVYNHWNGMVEWNTGMAYWNGGMEYWNGILKWHTGMNNLKLVVFLIAGFQ